MKQDKQKIKELLDNDTSKVLLGMFVDIVVRGTDIRNLEGKDPKVVSEAINMFTEWVESILGAKESFEMEADLTRRRENQIQNQIYRVEPEDE